MHYQLLGPMTVIIHDDTEVTLGGLRQRGVLAALLLAAGRTVATDTLVEMVWADAPPAKPIVSLRAYIANLRRLLGGQRVVTDRSGYRLNLGTDRLDIREFETLVADSRRLLDAGDHVAAARTVERSLRLWRGVPLADFRDQPFVHYEMHRLEALRADALETRFDAQLGMGRSWELIAALETEVAAHPLREKLWAQMMLAMYRSGRRADALHAYGRVRTLLERELGVRPSLELERLADEIRGESTELRWHRSVDATPRPSRLLGRSRELLVGHRALRMASEGRGGVVVVTGDHGAGKTALAAEIADMAEDLGMAAVWAGHPSGTRTPQSWAWTQVLRGLVGATEPGDEGSGRELAASTATAVAESATRWPAIVVLDDLHEADRFTHDVLEFLTVTIHRRPLLVLATWQDGGAGRPVRARTFDRLLSRCDVTTVALRGLDRDGAAALIESVAGCLPSPDLVAAIRARTDGNPFYIRELTRQLSDSGRLDATTRCVPAGLVPDPVSGVLRRRMAALPKATRTAVLGAALTGVQFDTARLAAAGIGGGAALEPALTAGLIRVDGPGMCRFSCALVRDAVLGQLDGPTRARLRGALAVAEPDAGATHSAAPSVSPVMA